MVPQIIVGRRANSSLLLTCWASRGLTKARDYQGSRLVSKQRETTRGMLNCAADPVSQKGVLLIDVLVLSFQASGRDASGDRRGRIAGVVSSRHRKWSFWPKRKGAAWLLDLSAPVACHILILVLLPRPPQLTLPTVLAT